MNACYLIITCEKTRFVVDYCLSSLKNIGIGENNVYISSDYEREFKIGKTILVSGKGFLKDCEESLIFLRDKYDYVILILDDFIFYGFDKASLVGILNNIKDIQYLRLSPAEYHRVKDPIEKVPKNHPYYSSLQVAIWNIEYLITLLKQSDNIWGLEKLKLGENHFCTRKHIFSYRHVVEKGKWDWRAKKIIEAANMTFNSNGVQHQYVSFRNKMKFFLVRIILKSLGYRFLK